MIPLRAIAVASLLLLGVGDRFIYYPTRYPAGEWSPARHGLAGAEDRFFAASDGTKLHGWWAPREGARGTLLFCHGNGGNLTNNAAAAARLRDRLEVSVLLFDYRGYGRSEGRPSEQGLYRDAEAAYEEAIRLGAKPERLILFGHSLGTAVATELALRKPAAGLVLEAPFTTIRAMVSRALPFIDPEKVVDERYDTLGKAPRLSLPVFLVHGTADRTIPVGMGRAVFGALPEPKRLLEIEGAGHADCSVRGGERYYSALAEFLHPALGGRAEF